MPISPRPAQQLDRYTATDSLLASLEEIPAISDRLDSLLLWTNLLQNYDPSAALTYAGKATHLATEHNYAFARGVSLYYLAMLLGREQIMAESMEKPLVYAHISYRLLNKTKHWDWQVRISNLIGHLLYLKASYDSSEVYLKKALTLTENAISDIRLQGEFRGEILHCLANVAYGRKEFVKADSLYQETANYHQLAGNVSAAARLRLAVANAASAARNFERADSLYQQCKDDALLREDRNLLGSIYQQYGSMFLTRYRGDSKPAYFNQALQWLKLSLKYQQANEYYTHRLIGQVFHSRLSREEGYEGYVDSAIWYYHMAMEEAREEGALAIYSETSNDLSNLCDWRTETTKRNCDELLGSTPMTFLDDNYQGVVDTITNHLNSANQQRFDFELAQEKADRRRHMRNIWFISSSVLLFIIVIAFGFGQYLKRKRAQAQMEALRAQINPHFISNSLNAIESLVNLDQREAAAKYLIHFSRLSRRILNGSRSSTSSLAEELETMRHYLTLEQLRFRDKLQYEIEVSPDLDADQLEMPAMILQPFIENAILHGIKPKSEPGRLLIKVFRRDKYLICVIEDDGIGREQAQRLKTQTALPGKHKSLGMKITRERLEGAGGRMEIEDLKSDTGEAVGTRVTLRVPYRRIREKEVVHGS